ALVVLFGFGVHGLWRNCMDRPIIGATGLSARLKSWWAKATLFERKWVKGCAFALGLSMIGWLIYSSSSQSLEKYLQSVFFEENMAKAIAAFSIRQVGWFVLFLALAVWLVTLILSGAFSGVRAKWGGALLVLLVVVDLGRANLRWPIYWDYK